MVIPPLHARRRIEEERRERLKYLLQEEVLDANAVAKELRPRALSCALDTKVFVDKTLLSDLEDMLCKGINVPEAHLILMRCHRDGIIVEKNRNRSNFHLAEAAKKGNHAARYLIATEAVKHSDPTIRYQATAEFIELALNGDYWEIKENALWRAVRILRDTFDVKTLSPEDAEFERFYENTFRNSDPALSALLKDAVAALSTSNARTGLAEDHDPKTVQAAAGKSEVEEWRRRARAFLASHHDRIKSLGNPDKEDALPAHLRNLARRPQNQEAEVLKASTVSRTKIGTKARERYEGLNIPVRVLAAAASIILGFLFFPLFFLGGLIAWSIYSDIIEAPDRQAQEAEIEARLNAPLSVDDLRRECESPAETAFLDAMVSAYSLQTGPGAIEGRGLRLRNQVGMGQLKIFSNYTSHQYRADFLIDEELVVEIDGATYHSSPEAIARDKRRDIDMRREGFSVLRIPAQIVFQNPVEAVRLVEDARTTLRKN